MIIDEILRIIEEQCLKMQFDEAEVLAEYLCTQGGDLEVSNYALGRVLAMQNKFASSIPILLRCTSAKAKYFLAQSNFAIANYEASLQILQSMEADFSDIDEKLPFLDFSLKGSDIRRLMAKAFEALGNVEKAAKLYSSCSKEDTSLVRSYQCGLSMESLLNESAPVFTDENLGSDRDNSPFVQYHKMNKRKRETLSPPKRESKRSSRGSISLSSLFEQIRIIALAHHGDISIAIKGLGCDQLYFLSARAYLLYEKECYEEVNFYSWVA